MTDERTSEELKADALTEFPYRPELVAAAGERFDRVVAKIQASDFRVARLPERKICRECDMRHVCVADSTLPGR